MDAYCNFAWFCDEHLDLHTFCDRRNCSCFFQQARCTGSLFFAAEPNAVGSHPFLHILQFSCASGQLRALKKSWYCMTLNWKDRAPFFAEDDGYSVQSVSRWRHCEDKQRGCRLAILNLYEFVTCYGVEGYQRSVGHVSRCLVPQGLLMTNPMTPAQNESQGKLRCNMRKDSLRIYMWKKNRRYSCLSISIWLNSL